MRFSTFTSSLLALYCAAARAQDPKEAETEQHVAEEGPLETNQFALDTIIHEEDNANSTVTDLVKRGSHTVNFVLEVFSGTFQCLDDSDVPMGDYWREMQVFHCAVWNRNQIFRYYRDHGHIYSPAKNACVEHENGKLYLRQCAWWGNNNRQLWYYSKETPGHTGGAIDFRFKAKSDWSKCLGVEEVQSPTGTPAATKVRLVDCYVDAHRAKYRQWYGLAAVNNYGPEFYIPSTESTKQNKCLGVWSNILRLETCNGSNNQKFRWHPTTRNVRNSATGRCLRRRSDMKIDVVSCNFGDNSQKFFAADGRIKISNWGNWQYCIWAVHDGHQAYAQIYNTAGKPHTDFAFAPVNSATILKKRATMQFLNFFTRFSRIFLPIFP